MSLSIKYALIYTDCLKECGSFYAEYFKLKLQHTFKFSADQNWHIYNHNELDLRLILIEVSHHDHHKSTIIINTDDCISTYCRLKEFQNMKISSPEYSEIGVSIKCYDPAGNQIIIIEQRKYSDIQI